MDVTSVEILIIFHTKDGALAFKRSIDTPKIGLHIPSQVKQMEKFFGDWDENGLTKPGTSLL